MDCTRRITVIVEDDHVENGETVASAHLKDTAVFAADPDRGFLTTAQELQSLLMRIGRDKSSRPRAQPSPKAQRRFPTEDEANTTIHTEG